MSTPTVGLLEKRRYLNNRSGDFPQVILIVPSHVPNSANILCVNYYFRQAPIFLAQMFWKSRFKIDEVIMIICSIVIIINSVLTLQVLTAKYQMIADLVK